MSKIVFFAFAGREENMRLQAPHVQALLDANPDSEFHLWDLTRRESDQQYLIDYAHSDERIRYTGQLHPGHPIVCNGPQRRGHPRCECIKHVPPYEDPYRWYRDQAAFNDRYDGDTTFVKFDDDVIWMDTARFGEVLEFLETNPRSIVSANVANNAVCAKHEPELHDLLRHEFRIGGLEPEHDEAWWALHIDAAFAEVSLLWLTEHGADQPDREPFRVRQGEKVSINFIAMKYPALVYAADRMRTAHLGDEGTFDAMLPWIVPNFRVAHLSFGPQEQALSFNRLTELRALFTPERIDR